MDNLSLTFENMGVQLPYNMEAEQAVLGAALLQGDCIPTLVEKLRPEHFYVRQNGEIFAELVRLFTSGAAIDFVTVLGAVLDAGVFAGEEEAKVYLTGLAETVPSISNVEHYAGIVYEKYLIRQLMGAAKDILEQTSEESDADILLESAEQKIYEIRSGRDQSAMQPISSTIIDTYNQLQKISGPDRDKYLGIPTGFTYLDKMLTGLGRSDLIILAARPGMGKTSFALNIARHAAVKAGRKVAFFSLEMGREQLCSRLLSTEALVGGTKLRTGKLADDEWVRLVEAGDILSKAPIYFDDNPSITVPEMKAKLRRLKDVDLVIIDYLQLMNGTSRRGGDNRVQEISEITRGLKVMAKELNIPVLTLSQLARDSEKRTSHRPVLSDLRDSGSIEQDADIVLFLYREDYYANEGDPEESDKNSGECIVAKNRHGEAKTVPLHWQGEFMRFTAQEAFRSEY